MAWRSWWFPEQESLQLVFWDHYGLGLSLNSLFSNHVTLGNKFPQLISSYQIEISKCSIFVWWGVNETGYDQYRRPSLEPETNAVSFWRYFQVYGQYRAPRLESETKAVSFWRYCQVCVPNSSITFMVISRKIKLNNKVSHMIFFSDKKLDYNGLSRWVYDFILHLSPEGWQ